MLQNKPIVYTELIDAIVVHETDKARKFRFGVGVYWIPKAVSKIIETKLYVAQRIATEKATEWNGEFEPGTRNTKMRAIANISAIEEIAKKLQQDLNALFKLIREHKQDTSTDETPK